MNGISPFRAGLIAVVLVVVGSYFAYTKANPFADPYQFSASFHTANNLKSDAPVRIAGVEVGVVNEVRPLEEGGEGAHVTMEIEDHGLPIHEDAELKIRPRIFLEGNEFVDLEPGSPSAPVLEDGGTIPVNQTATPVQFGQVLSVLQSDTREDLKTFLAEYASEALKGGGARGFRKSIRYWEDAYKSSALANEALLGTEEGDLSRVLRGQQRTFAALSSEPDDLRGLVTNFNTTAAAFAAEDDALQATVPALRDVLAVGRPALQSLNSSFPGIQRFAVDALPGVRSSETTIPESFPFVRQLRLLFQPAELRGLAGDLRRTIPPLARTNRRTIPFLQQNRALSACTNETLVPFARTPIPTGDPDPARPNRAVNRDFPPPSFGEDSEDSTMQPFYKQGPRAFTGLSGESRTSDANNKFFRANFKLDESPLQFFRLDPDVAENFPGSPSLGDRVLSLSTPNERARPAPTPDEDVPGSSVDEYRRTDFRPDFPCELSVEPDLRAEADDAMAQGEERSLPELIGLIEPLLPTSVSNQARRADDPEKQVEALIDVFEELSPGEAEEGQDEDQGGEDPQGSTEGER